MPGQRAIGPTQRPLFLNNLISKKHYVLKTDVYSRKREFMARKLVLTECIMVFL